MNDTASSSEKHINKRKVELRSKKLSVLSGDLVSQFYLYPKPDKWKLSAFDLASAFEQGAGACERPRLADSVEKLAEGVVTIRSISGV